MRQAAETAPAPVPLCYTLVSQGHKDMHTDSATAPATQPCQCILYEKWNLSHDKALRSLRHSLPVPVKPYHAAHPLTGCT